MKEKSMLSKIILRGASSGCG